MRKWEIVLFGYLLSAPLPPLALEAMGITLYYEQISWWLVAVYMAPLGVIAEPLFGTPFAVIIGLYWLIVGTVLGARLYLLRRRSSR